MDPITLPAILTLAQWQRAEQSAKQAVIQSMKPPHISEFMATQVSKYPRWLVVMSIASVVAILLRAFIISAGKQLVGYDAISGYLGSQERLSPLWVSVELISGVGFTELGAIAFMLFAAMFEGHRRLFHTTAFLSAGLAILANVAVTAGHDFGAPVMTLFAWVVTLFAPGIVLVGTLAGEQSILEYVDRRNQAKVEYEVARRDYAMQISHPDRHPDFASHLRRYWLETYRRQLKGNAALLDDPEVANRLMVRDFTFYMPNFMSPAALPDSSQPALLSGKR